MSREIDPYWWLETRDPPRLLWAVARQLGPGCRIAFEGRLGLLGLEGFPGASSAETSALRRQTLEPPLDFVVIPVGPATLDGLIRALGRRGTFGPSGRLIHVQVEQEGRLVFSACDNFHRRCVVAYPPLTESILAQWREQRLIRRWFRGEPA